MKLKSISDFFEHFKNLGKEKQEELYEKVESLLIKK